MDPMLGWTVPRGLPIRPCSPPSSRSAAGCETQLKAVPMRFEARPDVGNEGRVFRDLGRQRVNPSGSVQELAVRPRDRANANEDVADPEEAAERFAIDGVLKIRRFRFGDQ